MAKTIKSLENEIYLIKQDLNDMLAEKSKDEAEIKKLESEKKEIADELGKIKAALGRVEDFISEALRSEEEPDRKTVKTISFLLDLITDSEAGLIFFLSKEEEGLSFEGLGDLLKDKSPGK